MPYIAQEARRTLLPFIDRLNESILHNRMGDGAVNYAVTRIIAVCIVGVERYEKLERALGLLEAVKLELYRRLGAPYEDQKLLEHGEVYPQKEPER